MDIIKIIGVGMIALITTVILKQYRPEFSIYISLLAGAIILAMIFSKLNGILQLIQKLSEKTMINKGFLTILFKITGIAILTEYVSTVCIDTGERAIASKVEFGGRTIILSLSIPIISGLLETIVKILP